MEQGVLSLGVGVCVYRGVFSGDPTRSKGSKGSNVKYTVKPLRRRARDLP